MRNSIKAFETLAPPIIQRLPKSFDKVLRLDPAAGVSRAFCIACCLESGETNKAMALAKEFQDASTRWAQWAAAKTELEIGDVSNATVRLAFITTNFPTMGNRPQPGFDIWKKVDWQLFDRLTR
ncbi:MAG: hypothetical protein EXS35_04100 [Pedosphaera sp.]|nr:hypothetical protein [Pedosphaera sp.]